MRVFLALTSFKSHAWRGSPCWHRGPSLTTEPPSKKLAFSILRLESLTHPGCELPSSVRSRRVPPGHPALPFRLYLSDSESWSPVGRRREPPGQTTLPFPPHGRRDLPIQTASIFLPSDVGESLPATHLTFLCLYLSNAASLDLPLDAGEVLPARQILLSSVFTCPTRGVLISRWTPARCSRPDKLTFSVFTCPTQQVLVSRWTPARCSRPDKSYFSCLYLSNTASLNLQLDAWRGAPGQTILLFLSLPVQHGSLNLPLDAGEVLPASQTLFRLLAPKISNPVERAIPGRFGKLSFQSTTGEVPPPSSQVSISPQMPQEPPGWTTSPFPPSSAKLTHQTGGHAHQLDVG